MGTLRSCLIKGSEFTENKKRRKMTSNVRAVFAQIIGVSLKVGCYLNSYLNRLGEGDFGAQDGIENGFSKIGCYLIGSRDAVVELTNNMILKKLRIALNLHAEDMLKLFHIGGKTLANRELSVLFRKPTNKHYKACDDELLIAFLEGVKKSEELPVAR